MPSHSSSHSKAAAAASHHNHSHHHQHHHPQQQRHPLALTLAAEGANGRHQGPNNHNAERIEWSRSTILGFIEDYRRQRVLWDPNTKGYHIKQIKYEALKQLGLKYGTEIRSIRSKIKSLRSSFHREHGKVINGQRRGVHYQPMWFAYEAIHFILDGEQHQQQQQQPQPQQQQQEQQQQRYDNQRSAAAKRDTSLGERGKEDDDDDDVDDDDDCGNEDDDGNGVGDVDVDVDVDVVANAMCLDVRAERPPGNGDAVDVAKAAKRRRGASDYGDYNGVHNHAMTMAAAASCVDDDNNDGTPQQQRQQHVVRRADSDAEMQHFGNIISAEDVKTELIEADAAMDLHRSPLAYLALTPTVTSSSGKKRKRTPQPDAATLLLQSVTEGVVGGGGGAGSHQQLRDESQTALAATTYLSNSSSSSSRAAQEAASSTTATATASGAGAAEDYACHTINQNNNNNNSHHAKNNSTLSSFSAAGHVDEYGVFGEYVAITIRKLKTAKAKIVVKHLINNLLYEAELGHYDYGIPASKEPPQLYKT